MASDRRTDHLPRPPVWDVVAALALLAMGVVFALANVRYTEAAIDAYQGPSSSLIVPTMAMISLPVAVRRVVPLAALVVVAVGLLFMNIWEVPEYLVANAAGFLVLVSAGIHGRADRRDWARGLFALAVGAAYLSVFVFSSALSSETVPRVLVVATSLAQLVASTGFVALGWYLGNLERRRREQADELAERNRQLEVALDRIDRQSANEERLAIAREVHDIVGHSVSLMGVQAAAVRRRLRQDPEAAEAMLVSMEDRSREGVGELRSLIAVLRRPDDAPASSQPLPSIDRLDELIDEVKEAGMTVRYATVGSIRAGAGVGLSAYRVVQEALSNAIRHGDGEVEVVVEGDDRAITILVSNGLASRADDDDRPRTAARFRTGSGLAGMRERVGLHGGTLTYGRNRDGRFDLRAVLPVDPSPVVGEPVQASPSTPTSPSALGSAAL